MDARVGQLAFGRLYDQKTDAVLLHSETNVTVLSLQACSLNVGESSVRTIRADTSGQVGLENYTFQTPSVEITKAIFTAFPRWQFSTGFLTPREGLVRTYTYVESAQTWSHRALKNSM